MFEWSNCRTPGVQGATGPPSLVQLLYTESTGIVMDRFVGGVQSRTAGVRKCRSLQIVCYDLVNILEWCNGGTAGVQGAMGRLTLVHFVFKQPDSTVQSPTFGSCTHPYSRCTKMPFTADYFPRPIEHA